MERVYERQLALHEALRRLGFLPEEIYVSHNKRQPVVVLRALGKEVVIAVNAEAPETAEAYNAAWEEAVIAWNGNTLPESERRRIFEEHIVLSGVSVVLLALLVEKGFPIMAELIHERQREGSDA